MQTGREVKNEIRLVVFKLGGEEFGAPIHQVHEILRLVEITRVPRAPRFIEGVVNLRGRIIPILDLRRRFDLPLDTTPERKQRIMEVEVDEQILGMIVDEVSEVVRLPVDAIEPPPAMVADIAGEYLAGIGKLPGRIIIMLNFDKILSESETHQLEQASLESLPGGRAALPETSQREESECQPES
ncbi:MAG: chemotaxis protein CheW [candidate division FCPU426 bacterium]